MADSKTKILVVAIDFGTTYSGYAFSFLHDFKKDPLKIVANTAWNAGGQCLLSLKTPTVLLVDKQGKSYFGYEAQNKYMELAQDKDPQKHKEAYYFSLFKMKLHGDKTLSSSIDLEDETGKTMKALEVFRLSIKCLTEHLRETLKKQGIAVNSDEISWVLTVPAIWSDSAKQFMRQAAETAGIPGEDLRIALEPEAASLYCQHLPVDKLVDSKGSKFTVSKPGTKYMVVDMGGGTVDITVHEKLDGDQLKELTKASGGAFGGSAVNNELFNLWTRMVGAPTVSEFRNKCKEDYINMYREFEVTKRNVDPAKDTKTTMRIPATLNEICKRKNQESVGEIVAAQNFALKGEVETISDKLRLTSSMMKKLFEPAIRAIVSHVEEILKTPEAKGVSMMLLVGGFSECILVQNAMRAKFQTSNVRVIIPQDAGLAVLKGAVIFGHSPRSIRSRIIRYTYGVDITPPFDASKHPQHKKIISKGQTLCKDVFSPFMTKGRSVQAGHTKVASYSTLIPLQDTMRFRVFSSTEESPEFVTDECCQQIGNLRVGIPNPSQENQDVAVAYIFGDTEVKMVGAARAAGKPCMTSFRLTDH